MLSVTVFNQIKIPEQISTNTPKIKKIVCFWRFCEIFSLSHPCRITRYTPDLSQSDVDVTIAKALRLYSDVIPLDFQQINSGTADIMIMFKGQGSPLPLVLLRKCLISC